MKGKNYSRKLTTVKVDPKNFEDFQSQIPKTKINFQKLCDRSLSLYLSNEDFRRIIGNQLNIQVSGSI